MTSLMYHNLTSCFDQVGILDVCCGVGVQQRGLGTPHGILATPARDGLEPSLTTRGGPHCSWLSDMALY